MIFSNEIEQTVRENPIYRIVQFDDEGKYYAFIFDETTQDPVRDEHNNIVPLEFETEKEAREYAMENCMDNRYNAGWFVEKIE